MSELQQILPPTYWNEFQITQDDLEFLFNRLMELEEPQTIDELLEPLLLDRIHKERETFKKKQGKEATFYRPKDSFSPGQVLSFPALQWSKGTVISSRSGYNPQIGEFSVISVDFGENTVRQFASQLETHKLNDPVESQEDDDTNDYNIIYDQYGELIREKLTEALETDPDLVRIAGCYFPKSLLIDINQGHLNLSEAILEEVEGGPLPTEKLIEQVEIPPNVNKRLVEFSMDYALQEDNRFDEVGPTGETLWFLRRLEPEWVQNLPLYLNPGRQEYDPGTFQTDLKELENLVEDELSDNSSVPTPPDEIEISLIFPHWRAGTLPLTSTVSTFFPTADEAPRIQFTFLDAESKDKFPGWVVRPSKYVFGLRDWFEQHGLIPGSIVKLTRGENPGEIQIQVEKRRQNKEWVRTALFGADGGIVFAMLKQIVTATFDERMAIAIPDVEALESLWNSGKQRGNPETALDMMVHELAKLNPQGHVHAQELYACMNLLRRCSPGLILQGLLMGKKYQSLGNLYFKYADSAGDASND
jgi:hypothetical protein